MRVVALLSTRLVGAVVVVVTACCVPRPLAAQDFPSANESEQTLIRAELQRIIAEDPEQAADARKALDALDQPETTEAGRQARNRREHGVRRIVNGLPARGHLAVGALLKGADPRAAQAWCTGTLVGCDKFLTAAHCIIKDPSPGSYLVFFQELGFFEVKGIQWPTELYRHPEPYGDLAMVTLARPVEGIAPMALNVGVRPLNKSIATIVGFGRTGGAHYDYGVKREGSARTDICPAAYAQMKVLCWTYDADVKSLRRASNTCNGDSGGGVFMRDNDGPRVVQKVFGVVSGGLDRQCIKNDVSYNVDVSQFHQWIEAAGEGRLTASVCGRPLFGTRDSESKRLLARLTEETPEAVARLDVGPGFDALRVVMNGEDDGTGRNDFDLFVYRGESASDSMLACKGDGPGQFAFCEIKSPMPGRWTVVVRRKAGQGQVQVSATLVGKP